jgi:peptide/nickel transport system ATP-binding protein/oligopeptide transport system ATP-binding protein
MTLMTVKNLKKYYPVKKGIFRRVVGQIKAVDDVSFTINPQEILGVVGESGSGKTTLGRCLAGLAEPTSGTIELKEGFYQNSVQMVFQDPGGALNPRMAIGEALSEPLIYHKICSKNEAFERVKDILEKIGLGYDVFDRYPHEFSLGQKQRIAMGRALIVQPKLIICDEPVSALDVSIQAQILNLILNLRDNLGVTFVFITHDLNVVRAISDRIIVMSEGKIVEEGSPSELFEHPKEPYTQKLIAAIPGKGFFT